MNIYIYKYLYIYTYTYYIDSDIDLDIHKTEKMKNRRILFLNYLKMKLSIISFT